MRWYQRFFRRDLTEKHLDAELRFHLEHRIADLVAAGVAPEEARRRAQLEFGGLDQVKEECREVGASHILETFIQDIRYGLRQLRRNPGFTAVAVLTLALGIGANTAIFSLIDTVMLRFLPVEKPEELVQVRMGDLRSAGETYSEFTNPLWEQIRDQQDVFSGTFAWATERFDLSRGGAVHYAKAMYASGGLFQALGLRPQAGRLIAASDDQRGCAGVAVISYGFWQDHFGGEQNAVGRTISLNGHPVPIIGVAPRGFEGLDVGTSFDVAVPICMAGVLEGRDSFLDGRSTWWLKVFGRMKPGLSLDQIHARLSVLSPRIMAAALPQDLKPGDKKSFLNQLLMTAPAATGTSRLREQFKDPLQVLMGVVGLVLLIACANIAGLMRARAATRGKEIAVRQALGASRARLIRQLLTESVLLSFAGALVGVLLARWGDTLLVRLMSTTRSPVALDIALDTHVFTFTAVVAVLTGILFGLLPAFRSTRISMTMAMKGSQALEVEGRTRIRPGNWIVASQVALSLVLLIAAGLLLRSFWKLATLDIGFDRNNVLLVNAALQVAKVPPERCPATYDEIEKRLGALPGVISVGRSVITPISGAGWNGFLTADSPNPPTGMNSLAYRNFISPGYFTTLRIPLLAGRNFDNGDTPTAPPVAIINQTLARKFYPNLNPIGRYFHFQGAPGQAEPPIQIVGLVKDSKYGSLEEETPPTAFQPVTQTPSQVPWENFELRTAMRPLALTSAVQNAVAGVNKNIPLEFHTLADQVGDSLVQERTLAMLSAFFGGLALLLAMLGLYGALSYMVTQRQTEFGIRMSLGAPSGSILRLVMRQVVAILFVGILAGVGISLAATRVLQSMLFGLGPRDTVTLVGAVLALSFVALVAGFLPARRATKVDPMVALRYE
jgi:putative ABC transport system permease protein